MAGEPTHPVVMLGEQMTQMWTTLLGQMTSQGATRSDLILVTLATSGSILEASKEALWPRSESGERIVVRSNPVEHHSAEQFEYICAAVANATAALGHVIQGEEGRAVLEDGDTVEGSAEEVNPDVD
jgi:hypothetical protein